MNRASIIVLLLLAALLGMLVSIQAQSASRVHVVIGRLTVDPYDPFTAISSPEPPEARRGAVLGFCFRDHGG
jgi:hypothetical protein